MACLVALLVVGELSVTFVPAIRTWPFVPIQVYKGAPKSWVVGDVSIVLLTSRGELGLVESGLVDYNVSIGLKRLARGGPEEPEVQAETLDRYLRAEAARRQPGRFTGFRVYDTSYDLNTGRQSSGRCLMESAWR